MHDFDAAVQKANRWVREMAVELSTADDHEAYRALRAGIHALRDRLSIDEAVQLGAQLPLVVRGFYYEGWKPNRTPAHVRTEEDFLELVERHGPPGLAHDAIRVARATFRVLGRHLSPGETEAVKHVLPTKIAELWASAARA